MQNGSIEYPMNGTAALAPRNPVRKTGSAKIIQFPGMQKTEKASIAQAEENIIRINSAAATDSVCETIKNKLIECASYSEMLTGLRYDGLSGVSFANVTEQDKAIGVAVGLISMASILFLGM